MAVEGKAIRAGKPPRPWHVLRVVPPPARHHLPTGSQPSSPRWGDGGAEEPAQSPSMLTVTSLNGSMGLGLWEQPVGLGTPGTPITAHL